MKKLIFSDIVFAVFEFNLIFLSLMFNVFDASVIYSMISLVLVTIISYLLIRTFLQHNTVLENKDKFNKRLGIVASIIAIFSSLIFLIFDFEEKTSTIYSNVGVTSFKAFDLWLILLFYNNNAIKYTWRIISLCAFILLSAGIILCAIKKKYVLSAIFTILICGIPFICTIDYFNVNYLPYVNLIWYYVDYKVNPFGIIYLIITIAIFIYLFVSNKKVKAN